MPANLSKNALNSFVQAEIFTQLDVDRSGGLNLSELEGFVHILGVELTQDQLQEMIQDTMTSDTDGAEAEVDLEAFQRFVEPVIEALEKEQQRGETAALVGGGVRAMARGDYEPRSLRLFTLDNELRKLLIRLIALPVFDFCVLLLILSNAIMMAMEDPLRDVDHPTELELEMEKAEMVFNVLFTLEMSIKIVALGLFDGRHTYLQDTWNVLDATVVATSWLPYLLPDASAKAGGVRAFRLLRPLRTISRFPGLKRLVTTILMALPQMQVLGMMVGIYIFTFAVVGVQLWQGIMKQRCHDSTVSRPPCVAGEEAVCAAQRAMMLEDTAMFCDNASTGLFWEGAQCPGDDVCEAHSVNPYHGALNFDSFPYACIPVLQMATISSWQEVMHITMDTTGNLCVPYFLAGTVFGGYFLLNLFVAVLKNKFEISAAVAEEGASIFSTIDDDGSGELDEEELGRIFMTKGVSLTPEMLKEVFVSVDTDQGGTVDIQEFLSWLRSDDVLAAQLRERMDLGHSRLDGHQEDIPEGMPIMDTIREKLRRFEPDNDWANLFDYYDIEGDGRLSVDELSVLVRRDIGMRTDAISDEQIKQLFDEIDTHGSGDIDAGEFGAWVIQSSPEANWVKLKAAVRRDGAEHLKELVEAGEANAGDGSPGRRSPDQNFDDETKVRASGGMSPWKRRIVYVVNTTLFRRLAVVIVACNTVVLSLDHHGISTGAAIHLDTANTVLTCIFVVEMMMRMVAAGGEFFTDVTNVMDTIMLLGGVGDLATPADYDYLFVLFRAMRPLRLVYLVETLEPVFRVMINTFAGLVYIISLAALFMFIFAVLGMQLFGGEFDFGPRPRAHYDNFAAAFTTTFQITTFDSWQTVMYNGIRAGGGVTTLYFVAWVALGSMILLNLLLVIILDVYVQQAHATDAELQDDGGVSNGQQEEEFSNPLKQPGPSEDHHNTQNTLNSSSPGSQSADLGQISFEVEDEAIDMNSFTEKSCNLFSDTGPTRRMCKYVADSDKTDVFVIVLIFLNCVTMALDEPGLDPDSSRKRWLDVVDVFFTIAFTVEMCIRIIAFGFAESPDAYIKDNWNRLDFVIVVVSWVDYLASALEISFLRSFRALRPLRFANRSVGLKVLVDSLFESVSALSAIFTATIIVFVAYSILGVAMFKGRLWRCSDTIGVAGVDTCVGTSVVDGLMVTRSWSNPISNFDHLGHAMLTLFTVSTSNDWIIIAQLAIDADQVGQQPQTENRPLVIVYFITFIVVVNFFFLNLFIGVIYGKYVDFAQAGKEELSKDQKQWLAVLNQLAFAEPQRDLTLIKAEQSKGPRHTAFGLVTHRFFEGAIIGCILVNCIMMALTYDGEPKPWADTQAVLNGCFTLIFTAEALIKLFAFGPSVYFNDSWCRFDIFVVAGSWADLIMTHFDYELFSSSLFRIVRISRVLGRVGRIFKLLGDSKSTLGLDEIMECLYQALPQLGHIAVLVTLILFIFAVLGMNLFGRVAQTGCIGPNTNFEHSYSAMLTLVGVATKDRITCTIHAAMVAEPHCSEADGNCGEPLLAPVFFVAFSLIIMFTTLEMFVNVVLQSFEDLSSAAGLPITLAHIRAFEDSWKKFDPLATGWIPQGDLEELFEDLPREVGMDEIAGELPFDATHLRLIELPNGDFSRFLLGASQEEVKRTTTEAGDVERILRVTAHLFGKEDDHGDGEDTSLSADKVHDRLHEFGLSREEVGSMVRMLDADQDGDGVGAEGDADGKLTRREFMLGLTQFNETRKKAAEAGAHHAHDR